MLFTYIECTTPVIIWLISSNKHLCFYYIDVVNFITAIPKRDCNKRTNHRMWEIEQKMNMSHNHWKDKKMRQIVEYQYPDFEEDNDWALKTNVQWQMKIRLNTQVVVHYVPNTLTKSSLFLPNSYWQSKDKYKIHSKRINMSGMEEDEFFKHCHRFLWGLTNTHFWKSESWNSKAISPLRGKYSLSWWFRW